MIFIFGRIDSELDSDFLTWFFRPTECMNGYCGKCKKCENSKTACVSDSSSKTKPKTKWLLLMDNCNLQVTLQQLKMKTR